MASDDQSSAKIPNSSIDMEHKMEIDPEDALNSIPLEALELLPCNFNIENSSFLNCGNVSQGESSSSDDSAVPVGAKRLDTPPAPSGCECHLCICDKLTPSSSSTQVGKFAEWMEIQQSADEMPSSDGACSCGKTGATDHKTGGGDAQAKAAMAEKCTMVSAASAGDIDLMRAIVQDTVSQGNVPLKEWNYALLLAVNKRNTAMVDYLLSLKGVTADLSLFNCWYPVSLIAIDLNDAAMVDILLNHGASFHETSPRGNALHCAARVGNVEIMRKILDAEGSQLNLNAKNKGDEMTPLHVAVQHDNWDCARLLIERGCEVDETEFCKGRNPLHYAAMKGNLDIVKLLLDRGTNHLSCDGDNYVPWMLAAANSHTQVMERLMVGANVNTPLEHNMTLLHLAAKTGNLKCMRLLLSMGANINAVDIQGNTPLYYAASQKHVQVCKILCRRRDCDVNIANPFDETPLHGALENSMDASAKLTLSVLKTAGADLDITDSNQFTPLMTYIYSHEMAQWLLEAGADPNVVTEDGHTVFFEAIKVAVSENTEKTLWMLLRANVDISTTRHVVAETNLTPLQHVLKQRADKIASFMLNIGCSLRGMRQWLKTEEAEDLRTTSAMAAVMDRLQKKVEQEPSNLQMLSRSAVLSCLGHKNLQKNIADLDIPDLLKGYLNWETFAEWSRFEDSKLLNDSSRSGKL